MSEMASPVVFLIPEDTYKALATEAGKRNMTPAALIATALQEYVKEHKAPGAGPSMLVEG